MQSFESFLEFAADFTAGVLPGKYFRKTSRVTDKFGRRVARLQVAAPGENGSFDPRRTAGCGRHFPRLGNENARAEQRFQGRAEARK